MDSARTAGARDVNYVPELDDLPAALASAAKYGDVVVTLGAGSIERVGPALVSAMQEPAHA